MYIFREVLKHRTFNKKWVINKSKLLMLFFPNCMELLCFHPSLHWKPRPGSQESFTVLYWESDLLSHIPQGRQREEGCQRMKVLFLCYFRVLTAGDPAILKSCPDNDLYIWGNVQGDSRQWTESWLGTLVGMEPSGKCWNWSTWLRFSLQNLVLRLYPSLPSLMKE